MSKVVRKSLNEVPLTAAAKRRLKKLAERKDAAVDCSDIAPLDERFWANAVRNPFYRPVKRQLTVRLDADIVEWLRARSGAEGQGYQTKLNAVLRGAMLRDLDKSA